MTPLERKQIQIQATKDVLFEQKATKDSSKNDEHDEDAEMEDVDDTTATATKKSRKRKTKSKKSADEAQDKQGVRIEGLNFKVSLPRIPYIYYRTLLTCAACCARDHGARSSLKHQCTRHRSFFTE